MKRAQRTDIPYERLQLAGVSYAVVREDLLVDLCRRANAVAITTNAPTTQSAPPIPTDLDGKRLAERLVSRRKRAGITQAALARNAGVRVETLNRIERGHTTPDFKTIRKLVVALTQAEAILAP